jgi:LCP family protein required for cell wall assembly
MTKKQPLLDGFVPRRAGSTLGEHHSPKDTPAPPKTTHGLTPRGADLGARSTAVRPSSVASIRGEIDESLKSIDDGDTGNKKGKKGRQRKPISRRRRIIKWTAIGLGIIILAIGAWVAYRALTAGNNIFKGNILDIVAQNKPLKEDANGRSNILVLGTSEDDPGHDAPYLTDTIMILSIDQKNKNAYMLSLPRDLQVQNGELCESGSRGKINEYYHWCAGGANGNVEADRVALTKTAGFVGGLLGLDIQYGVNVNYTVMRDLVNAVGGITVTIESRDSNGQMDSNFDWKCGVTGVRVYRSAKEKQICPPSGHYIDYPNGPVQLDAEHALYLAQARGDTPPTYGFEQSNFDREKNQQKIVKAIREKAMSAGVLTDFGRVTGIFDALGNNLRTTFETSEVRTLVSLAKDIQDQDIQSISLIDQEPPLMDGSGQPTEGVFKFSAIQAFLKKKLSSDPVVREEAKVAVFNGSGVSGVGQTQADKLEAAGFTISNVSTAPAGTYADVTIYQIGDGKTGTKAKLESTFGVSAVTTAPPVSVAEGTNFVIIFGKDPQAKTQ